MPFDLVPLSGGEMSPRIAELLDRAKGLVAEELAVSTREGYMRDFRAFTAWCQRHGLPSMPATSSAVAAYITDIEMTGRLRGPTLSRRLAGIGWCHKVRGAADPTKGPAIRSLLRSVRRNLGVAPVNRKAALTPDQLVTMLDLCPNTLAGKRDRALLALGWAAALRRSELVALTVEDIEYVQGGVHLHIRRSKTDQPGEGQTIALPDRPRDRIRPVREVRAWLKAARIKSGPIFCRVNKSGRLQAPLDGGSVGTIVKKYAGLAGFDADTLGGHSLRVGFVTAAAATGASAAEMANVTRHSDMNVLFGYIRTANLIGDYPAAILR